MNRQISSLIYLVFLVWLLVAGGPVAFADRAITELDRVVASIDGEPVTLSDLSAYREYFKKIGRTFETKDGKEESSLSPEFLREYLLSQLLEKEAAAKNVSVDEGEIDAYIEEIKRQNSVDEKGFESILKQRGLSLDSYRVQVREDILRTRVVAASVQSKINVMDKDVESFLKEHPERKPADGAVHLYEISIPVTPSTKTAARSEIEAMRARVLAGESWQAVGRKFFSDLGFLLPKNLKSDLASAIEGLEVGSVSDPIEMKGRVVLLSVVDKQGEDGSLAETLKSKIKNELYEDRFQKRVKAYLNEELPDKYNVELLL